MRLLGLDVGDRRIGVALSDPTGLIASPLMALTRSGDPEDVEALLSLAAENGVQAIVVGLPLSLSGRVGAQAAAVRRFVGLLSSHTAIPVTMEDERYSTVEAGRRISEAGGAPTRDRGRLDAAAAAVILQSYLDSHRTTADMSQ